MNTTKTEPLRWNDIVDYDRACRLLGMTAAEIDRMTTAHMECRATGAWDANERERHVGYRSIVEHRRTVRRFQPAS